MSVIKTWSLGCDHPECGDADAWDSSLDYRTLGRLRADAKAAGWTRRNGKDFCPDHSASTTGSTG